MVRKFIQRIRSVKSIANSYDSYSDYAQNASDTEKKKIIEEAVKKANKIQREVAGISH